MCCDNCNKKADQYFQVIDDKFCPGCAKLYGALELVRQDQWDKANKVLGGFGIEYVSCGDRELKYINLGDTYTITICQENDKPFIDSWGNWYEQTEQDYELENDVIRCGYCGEFTPMDQEDRRDVVCESCGNCVAG